MAKDKKKKGMSLKTRLFMIMGLILAALFMPTAIVVVIGMLPTAVALITDPARPKTRAVTVGAMNLAGCMPFVLQLWTSNNNTAPQAIGLITDPRTIIVMYCAAAVGYIIDWAVSGLVSSVMVQSGSLRVQQIAKRQAELVQRWGREVTGEVATDRQGFPLEAAKNKSDIKD